MRDGVELEAAGTIERDVEAAEGRTSEAEVDGEREAVRVLAAEVAEVRAEQRALMEKVEALRNPSIDFPASETGVGEIFDPLNYFTGRTSSNMTVALPKDIWTSALLTPLLTLHSDRGYYRLSCALGVVASVTAQCLFIYYLALIVDAQDGNCSRGATGLRVVCLAILASRIAVTEVLPALAVRRWINCFPDWDEATHRPIVEAQKTYLAMRRVRTETLSKTQVAYCFVTGLTPRFKTFALVGVVLPKLAIAATTLAWSGAYVAFARGNEALFLQVLAALFIVEVDNYAYDYFVPPRMKRFIETLPPVGLLPQGHLSPDARRALGGSRVRGSDVLWSLLQGPLLAPSLFLAVALLYFGWCRTNPLAFYLALGVFFLVCALFFAFWVASCRNQRGSITFHDLAPH